MKNGKFKIPLIYLLIGLIWVPVGNMGILTLGLDEKSELIRLLIVSKGLLFVLATAFLLYLLIAREQKRIIYHERQYSDIYESNPNPIWFYDPKSLRFVSVNNAAISQYGYTRNEFLAMEVSILQAAGHSLSKPVMEPSATGINQHYTKEGNLIYVNVSSHEMLLNDKKVIMVMAIDSTDKFLYEQQLLQINNELLKQKSELDKNVLRQGKIINSIIEAYFTLNKELVITNANENFYRLTGIEESVIGKTWKSISRDHENTNIFQQILTAGMQTSTMKFEAFSEALNKWLAFSVYPEEGETVIYFTDITIEKEKDIQLKLALERYDIASHATGEVIYDWDLSNDNLVFSKEISTLVQSPLSQIGNTLHWWRELVHPDDLEHLILKHQKGTFSKEKYWNAEYRIKTGNGQYKYVYDQCHLITDNAIKPVRAIGALRDIDLLKRSVDQLKTMGDILNKISSSVIISNAQGDITWVNPGFTELKGYSAAEVLGKRHTSYLSGKDTDELRVAQIREALQNKEAFSAEISNYNTADKEYWVTLNLSPIFDQKGELESFISVENDITERKDKEAQLEAQQEKLQVVSWLNSHQLRRPVASILGLSALMRMTEDEKEKEELFELLCQCTVELDQIIHQINAEASGQMI